MTAAGKTGAQLFARLLKQTRPYLKIFIFACLAMMITALSELFLPWFMKAVMEAINKVDKSRMIDLALLLVGIFVFRGVFEFLSKYYMAWISRKVIGDVRGMMFDRLVGLPVSYYDRSDTGSLLSKFSYDVEQIAQAVTNSVYILIKDSLTVVALLSYMFYQNWALTLEIVIAGPFVAVLITKISKKLRSRSARLQVSMGEVNQAVHQALKGHTVIKMFGGKRFEQKRFHEINERNRRLNMRFAAINFANVPLMQLIAAIAFAMIIVTMIPFLAEVTAEGFVVYFTSMMLVMPAIRRLTTVNAPLQRGITAAGSLYDLIDSQMELDTGTVEKESLNGEIIIKDIYFTYSSQEDAALRGISMAVRPHQTIALVGRSGSGKSTLVKLLSRFYEPDSGSIEIDGVDIKSFSLENLRRHIAYVGQDVVLFNDTIARNIAYAMDSVDQEKLNNVLEASHAREFIEREPEGVDTMVGENGVLLSGGQRQRLVIARALYKSAQILILDEATSALDTESEQMVQEGLNNLMAGKTTIVIAHRLSTVENADRIFVMDKGLVVCEGRHQQLLANCELYRQLYQNKFQDE